MLTSAHMGSQRQSLTTVTVSRKAVAVRRSPWRSSGPGLAIAAIMAMAAPGCGFGSSSAKPGPDAGVDAPGGTADDAGPSDAPPTGNGFCYGPSGWQVCLDKKATGEVHLQGIQGLPGTLDTDRSDAKDPCLKDQPTSWTATQPDACIIVADTVTVDLVRVMGNRPLVIVAQTKIDVTGLLDLASHRSSDPGAGTGSTGDCTAFGGSPGNGPPGGGGAGGSFKFPGGNGGPGNGTGVGTVAGGQAAAAVVGAPGRLRGGCAGQPGAGGGSTGGGAGGGAVYLVSAGTISISGTIDVSGAGGAGDNAQHGGGGGGSGGMIVLFAPSIATMGSTILIADGGCGGGGSSGPTPDPAHLTASGGDGHEPSLTNPTAAAGGGAGGFLSASGAMGGAGGSAYPGAALALTGEAGDIGAGGGGGGGGGGYIRSSQALDAGASVSPPVDIVKP